MLAVPGNSVNWLLSPCSLLDWLWSLLFCCAAKNFHDQREKYRSKKDPEKGHTDHSSKDGCTQCLVHFGPCALGDHQRQHAKNKRERGHENRPQTQSGSFRRSLDASHPRLQLLSSKLDDQNRILTGKSAQHDESDLSKNIIVLSSKIDPGHGRQ